MGYSPQRHTESDTTEATQRSEENGTMPTAETWVDLEIIILCEASQKKTNTV